MSLIGSTLGHIRIESRLGTGGMGEVYLGYDPRLQRRVAVKAIRPEHRPSADVKARFLREARLLSKLGHPGICQVYDLMETPGADVLVLEYVEGKTLKAAAAELGYEEKLRLAEKIANALAAAHQEKIVHRDLKADNIMVTPGGEVKVLDFGIARSVAEVSGIRPAAGPGSGSRDDIDLTQHGDILGTARAMSPEQARGGRITEASDLYSFGILLQELFTGRAAYDAKNPVEVLSQVIRGETRPITGLDPDLTALLRDLQSLDARRRPTAAQAAERLRWILDRPQRLRRRRLRAMALAAAFLVLVVLLGVVSWQAVEADRKLRSACEALERLGHQPAACR